MVYPNAADADAISTAVMAGGPKLIPIVERRFPGVAIIAIQSDEKLIMNNAALKIFQKIRRIKSIHEKRYCLFSSLQLFLFNWWFFLFKT